MLEKKYQTFWGESGAWSLNMMMISERNLLLQSFAGVYFQVRYKGITFRYFPRRGCHKPLV